MLHTWKPQLKRYYSLIEPSATSTSTRLFNWIFLSCRRDRHPFYACCVWLLVFCTFARFHGICLGNKVARARIKVMNGFPRGPTTTSILVTSSSIQKWIWPGLIETTAKPGALSHAGFARWLECHGHHRGSSRNAKEGLSISISNWLSFP